MKTSAVAASDIGRAVWAVPPVCRKPDGALADSENRKLVAHIEAGGVSTILWGGNANLYDVTVAEFAALAERLPEWVADDSWAIPSVGPDYGKLREHAAILKKTRFPAAMLLPYAGPRSAEGVERAIRDFVQQAGMPAILYLRATDYLPADRIAALFADGSLAALKYAAETGDLTHDAYLEAICAACPRERIVSGIGEIAAIPHLSHFSLAGFTAGAVCIAPRRAMAILRALKRGDRAEAEALVAPIYPLEDLRGAHGPVPVIHEAVALAGIADTGPLRPHLAPLPEALRSRIGAAAAHLREADAELAG